MSQPRRHIRTRIASWPCAIDWRGRNSRPPLFDPNKVSIAETHFFGACIRNNDSNRPADNDSSQQPHFSAPAIRSSDIDDVGPSMARRRFHKKYCFALRSIAWSYAGEQLGLIR
jgi:hypothetical protein